MAGIGHRSRPAQASALQGKGRRAGHPHQTGTAPEASGEAQHYRGGRW